MEAKDLIQHLLVLDPSERLGSTQDIKQHAFFAKIDWETLWNVIPPVMQSGGSLARDLSLLPPLPPSLLHTPATEMLMDPFELEASSGGGVGLSESEQRPAEEEEAGGGGGGGHAEEQLMTSGGGDKLVRRKSRLDEVGGRKTKAWLAKRLGSRGVTETSGSTWYECLAVFCSLFHFHFFLRRGGASGWACVVTSDASNGTFLMGFSFSFLLFRFGTWSYSYSFLDSRNPRSSSSS